MEPERVRCYRLATGIAMPEQGNVTIRGSIAALMELGAGFHPDLSGAENLVLNASLLGLSRKKTYEEFDSIVEFSGIGEFIEEPLRTYSSGMILRLAFAVAVLAAAAAAAAAVESLTFSSSMKCWRWGTSSSRANASTKSNVSSGKERL